MKLKTLLMVVLFALISCGAKSKSIEATTQHDERPKRVDNPASVYSDSKYLTAVGGGDTRTAAEDNARGNISKIFQSDITVDHTLMINIQETNTELSESMQMVTNTNVKSNQTLKNIKIGEAWFSPNEGRYYVIAYLKRFETSMIYQEEMDKNMGIAQTSYDQAGSHDKAFAKYAYLSKASDALAVNNLLESQLIIINPNSPYMEPENLRTNVGEELRKVRAKITCYVETEGELEDEISASIREMLAMFMFPIVSSEAEAKLVFKATSSMEHVTLNTAGYFYNYDVTIDLTDRLNGQTVETFNTRGREGHVDEVAARKRVGHSIGKKINKDYYKKLSQYIKSFAK